MGKNRSVKNDEIVDSILDVTVQCGLAVSSVQISEETVEIHIQDVKRPITLRKSEVPDMTLAQLKKVIEEPMNE